MVYALIMAGGVGSRFWPSSRKTKPKQFLNLIGDQSLLQQTVSRISPVIPEERILVITNASYTELVKSQVPEIPEENIIGEPIGRDTAPCVAFTSKMIYEKDPEATLVVLPSDHYVNDGETYRKVIQAGIEKAAEGDNLLTIGIKPFRPETGYGYIQIVEEAAEKSNSLAIHKVKTFAEKPDLQTAARFLESGDFLWNSGMFIWRVDTILSELSQHLPDIYAACRNVKTGSAEEIKQFYDISLSISIDYGVMEKSDSVFVIPADFGWSDVGSWMSVYELRDKDQNGNVVEASQTALYESHNCYIQSENDRIVSVVGLQGIAVIDTNDALLVCRLDASQQVKQVYESLKNGKSNFQ